MSEFAKLKWQCRRGTLELDRLLSGYLENHYAAAENREQQSFIALLTMEDDLLQGYLLGNAQPETAALRQLILKIRDHA